MKYLNLIRCEGKKEFKCEMDADDDVGEEGEEMKITRRWQIDDDEKWIKNSRTFWLPRLCAIDFYHRDGLFWGHFQVKFVISVHCHLSNWVSHKYKHKHNMNYYTIDWEKTKQISEKVNKKHNGTSSKTP